MIFYKEYNQTDKLNQHIKINPQWQHEVVGYSVIYPNGGVSRRFTLVKWSPKTKPAEEFKYEQ